MAAKTMTLHKITRAPVQHPTDTLNFNPGVNVLVGPPNTGKTQWLKMIDYLLGDDSPAEECLAEEIFEQYESAVLTVSIAGQDLSIERRWKAPGFKTKIFVNGDGLNRKEFCNELLRLLSIPIVHYPQGDPYGSRSWPELSWRSLIRHMYRRQRFWTDLADRQFDSEQHACLMQFLGLAKNTFSNEYGTLVTRRKKIEDLKQKRDHYLSMLHEISVEVIDAEDLGIAITPQSIKLASERMQSEISQLQEKRQALMLDLLDRVTTKAESSQKETVQQLGEDLANFQATRESLIANMKKTEERLTELNEYRRLIEDESSRIQRTERAEEVLRTIKITHCPACDRQIDKLSSDNNECVLCHRPLESQSDTRMNPEKRLGFEKHQLQIESVEAQDLIDALTREQQNEKMQLQVLNEKIHTTRTNLRPSQVSAAAIIPPEIAIYDMEIGRIEERLQQLRRIDISLKKREDISEEIVLLQKEVDQLERKVYKLNAETNFEVAADFLADSMNTYLNLIQRSKPVFWSQQPVAVDFNSRDFKLFVGQRHWRSKLGGTTTLIFLMAYHYGLMSLTGKNDHNYPGLLILDFPAELEDGSTVRDKENFVLDPFVGLTSQSDMVDTQVIAAGSAFENLEGAERIELHHIWK